MKKKRLLLLTGLLTTSCAIILTTTFNVSSAQLYSENYSDWVHYSSIEPTLNAPGFREFYVDCVSHTHSLTKPESYREGVWTDSKKSQIASIENDDRYLKSFTEVDAMLNDKTGYGAYDFISIDPAINYIDTNYSTSAKASYITESNKVYKVKEVYDSCFSNVFNTKKSSYYNGSTNFTLSQTDDVLYGPCIEIKNTVAYSAQSSFEFTKASGHVHYLPTSLESISFAIYSTEVCTLSFGVIYDNWSSGNYFFTNSLKVGWNEYTFNKGSKEYIALTTSPDGTKEFTSLHVVLDGSHTSGSVIKIASFIGMDSSQRVVNIINDLPSTNDLTAYDISSLNDVQKAYDSLSDSLKLNVTNYNDYLTKKKYWDSKYVLLYDMDASYADFATDCTLTEQTIKDDKYGYTRFVKVDVAGNYIDINNINKAYTSLSLSKIVYMVKPSTDAFMSWSQQSNYGRREWEGTTKLPDIIQKADSWNEFVIEGTIDGTNAVDRFMSDFNNTTTARIDFTKSSDRWSGYLQKEVGFNFQMSSIIGFKTVNKNVTKIINDINALPDPSSVTLSLSETISNIETSFEQLDSSDKELITNIDKLYECSRNININYPYLIQPTVKIESPWQVNDIVTSNIVTGVATPYGNAYKLPVSKETWGVTLKLYTGLLPESSTGFDIYVKNFSKTIELGKEYGVTLASKTGVSLGDNWYKYSFTAEDLTTLRNASISVLLIKINPQKPTSGSVSAGTEIYLSGLFTSPNSDVTNRTAVQTKIDNFISNLSLDEFSINQLKSIYNDIYSLNGYDQGLLNNVDIIENAYALYKKNYSDAYSLYVYNPGKYSSTSSSTLELNNDDTYGTIATLTQNGTNQPHVTIGSWNMKTYSGSMRGYGRSLSPLEYGKYETVNFAVYSPVAGEVSVNAYNDSDVSISILSQNVVAGWNKITISEASLNALCGKNGTFKGIDISLPKSTSGQTYKVSNFIGKKNLSYTGSDYHYAQDSLHLGAYYIESSKIKLVENNFSSYKLVASNSEVTNEAVNFFTSKMNEAVGVNFTKATGLNASSNSRHIVFDDIYGMMVVGISIPSKDVIGETGYSITTAGNSLFVFAYSKDGYRNAVVKLLEVLVGYEYYSQDMELFEKNGVSLKGFETIYLPECDIIEKPDYDYAFASNSIEYGDYGSRLENRGEIFYQKHVEVFKYLPTDTYSDCYYEINYDPTLDINSSIVCFNAKGNETRRNQMIQVIGDQIIADESLYPDRPFAPVFQGDSTKHCNCSKCSAQQSTYGSASAADVLFMNDLDNYIKANYKTNSIKLGFMAYNATKNAPTGLMCNDDVVPVIALLSARWNKSFYDIENSSGVGENGYTYDNDFAKIVEGWSAVSNQYTTYAYQIQNGSFLYTYNTFESIYDQYRYFYNQGCTTMLNEGNWCDAGSAFVSFKDFLDSKALFDVNGSLDEYIELFFKHYYGAAGQYMKKIFDESVNNTNYLYDKYGRGTSYNPSSHPTSTGTYLKTYYYDGAVGIDEPINFEKFWNNTNGIYNGETSKNHDNIANVKGWVEYANAAVAAVENTDPIAFKHVKRDVIFAYWANYEMFDDSTYNERICQYAYDTDVHWDSEKSARTDGYSWGNGTNTICYLLTGQTFNQKFPS